MLSKASRERSERGVTVQTLLLISVFVVAVGAASVWLFNLLGDTRDSLEQAARGKLIYQADCDLTYAQPRARPLPWGMTEDAAGSKLLVDRITKLDGNPKDYRYWEFPLSETLDESREKAELNLIGQAIQGPENISLTSQVSALRFYDRFTVPFKSLSINTPQESINIRYRSLPEYMHPVFEAAIPDGGTQQNQQNAFEAINPPPTAPPAGFLRLVENLVVAFNQQDGCWGFKLTGVAPPPVARSTVAPQTPGTPAPTTPPTQVSIPASSPVSIQKRTEDQTKNRSEFPKNVGCGKHPERHTSSHILLSEHFDLCICRVVYLGSRDSPRAQRFVLDPRRAAA